MRKSLGPVFCLVCIWTFMSAFVTESQAGDKKDLDNARPLFKQGTVYFKKAAYSEAAESFRAAYKTKPNWKILYNLAQSEAAAKRHGLALTAFERYLALGGDDVAETRQDEVEKEIARLKKMVGYVSVDAPEGATIIVDGVECGVAPIVGGIPVAGSLVHIVDLLMPDGEKLPLKKVSLVSGNKIKISFLSEEEKPASGPVPGPVSDDDAAGQQQRDGVEPLKVKPATEDKRKMTSLELAGWITAGVGGAMLIGAGVTGGLTLSTQNQIDEKCPEGCYEPDHHLVDKRNNLALTTDALFGVGGAVTAAGAGIVIYNLIKKKKERPDAQAFLFQPIFSPEVAGAAVKVRF